MKLFFPWFVVLGVTAALPRAFALDQGANVACAIALDEIALQRPSLLTLRNLPTKVFGPRPGPGEVLLKAQQDHLMAKWAGQARLYVSKLGGAATLRADVYEVLMREIVSRSAEWKRGLGDPFFFERYTTEGGIEFFVGEIGHFMEIRPDGSCWAGVVSIFQNSDAPAPGEPGYRPPYSADGLPDENRILKRYRVDPNFKPQ